MTHGKEKQAFENALEIVLKAQPEAVLPVIHTIASELKFSDGNYYFLDITEPRDIKASIDRCKIGVVNTTKRDSGGIGVATLQPFPENCTLFRVPPRSKWEIGNCELDVDGTLFTIFIQRLFVEFQRIGFIDFKEEKPPLGFKTHYREK